MHFNSDTALILIDLQNDFCRGGALAVPDGDAIIPLANQLQAHFAIVLASQDWHGADHISFASNHPGKKPGDIIQLPGGLNQILWPAHCVQNTPGAQFHPQLQQAKIQCIFYKGSDKNIDSYSVFFDNAHLRATGLAEYLHNQNITTLYFVGLATDYCVKYSALDAQELGFTVYVITDACRAVELNPGDGARALAELTAAGVKLCTSAEILGRL